MRTAGDVIMVLAVVAICWVGYVAGYAINDRPLREIFRPVEWPMRRSPHLRFFAEHSAWTVFLPLILLLGVGWVLRHYG
jgi:hypothetical protein